jgi:hypothetical protein
MGIKKITPTDIDGQIKSGGCVTRGNQMTVLLYGLEPHHKNTLKKISEKLISPQEFLAHYPGLTHEDLAEICQCSHATVSHWFSQGKSRREPKQSHLLWLTVAHHALQKIEQQRKTA